MVGQNRQQGLSSAIVVVVADAEGVEPTELAEPLFNAINPGALDSLFRSGEGQVTFEYLDYEVTAHATGEVDIQPRDPD